MINFYHFKTGSSKKTTRQYIPNIKTQNHIISEVQVSRRAFYLELRHKALAQNGISFGQLGSTNQ